jgi:hypothetical protein
MAVLIDILLALGTALVTTLIGWIPVVDLSIPVVDMSAFTGALQMWSQVAPLSTWATQIGIAAAAGLAVVIWQGANLIWKRLPVLGHGSL